ncbi:MAG TPA: endonuclease MutS2 [Epulopiscium sp.]|nr:endonuclease MutS2 [Candidatus Epulonipiscium sp.]
MNSKVLKTLEYNKIIEKLLSKAHSPMGIEKIKALMPSSDIEEVTKRQKETADAVSMSFRKGRIPMGGLKDIRIALKRVEIGAVLASTELVHIADVMRCAKRVKDYAKNEGKEQFYPALDPIFEQVMTFPHIEHEINRCIIGPDEFADDATRTLFNIRREIKSHNARIREQLNSIIQSRHYQTMLQDPVITIRQDRYCVPIKSEHKGNFPGIIHDQSSTGATFFIEPMAVVEIGNKIRELELKEVAEIEKILTDLTFLVEDELIEINLTLEALSLLDFISAKAELGIEMRAIEPKLNTNRYINLRRARHPLLNPKEVVPIDVYLGGEFTTLLVTGPNTGGKTVTLKTLGLLTIMGQAGLHIPADDKSEIAVFDDVFADIGDEQSIEQSLSTFSSHMNNIVKILEDLTLNSLVLFDELGSGTDPVEGAALAMAILEHLRKQEIRTAATTHYSELKFYALSTNGVENASCEFNVETLSPTYKLLIGIPGKSNAFEISRKLGLPNYLVEEAKVLMEKGDINLEEIIIDLEESKKQAINERQKATQYREEASKLKEKMEAQKEELAKQKEKILDAARMEAKLILDDAKEETDFIVKELKAEARKSQTMLNDRGIEGAREALRDKIKSHDATMKQAMKPRNTLKPVKDLKIGEEVRVLTLGQTGIVQRLPDRSGNVLVQLGIMQMKVHISNLQYVEVLKAKKKNTKEKAIGGSRNISKSQHISMEIDVRGQLSDEAIQNIDKYLDDAHLAGLKTVTIIHGKGTGALRTAVQQMLRRNPHAESYRLGKYGEGEAGVTVVELK